MKAVWFIGGILAGLFTWVQLLLFIGLIGESWEFAIYGGWFSLILDAAAVGLCLLCFRKAILNPKSIGRKPQLSADSNSQLKEDKSYASQGETENIEQPTDGPDWSNIARGRTVRAMIDRTPFQARELLVYGIVFFMVPGACVLLSSILYYIWRKVQPAKADQINRLGFAIFGLQILVIGFLFLGLMFLGNSGLIKRGDSKKAEIELR